MIFNIQQRLEIMDMDLYHQTCFECSKVITQRYSTSFTLGIKTLDRRFHKPIYAIYGFVRFADEIVDTFHKHDKTLLLNKFRKDTWEALEEKISLNPVLQSFQQVVHQYGIERSLVEDFLKSMEMDLHFHAYQARDYNQYIYGSAEVVGLMCLRVFCEGEQSAYLQLREPARSLGAAFQKVNFLRDMKSDFDERGRMYFPGVDFQDFSKSAKELIEEEISMDFKNAYLGILQLPKGAQMGVFLAYSYYLKLFEKIRKCPPSRILQGRIRVADPKKISMLLFTLLRFRFNSL